MTTFNPLYSSAIPIETALEQVADDEDFLKEVLADLITESNTAEEDLADAIKNKNLDGVMKAAHRYTLEDSNSPLHIAFVFHSFTPLLFFLFAWIVALIFVCKIGSREVHRIYVVIN